MEVSSRLGAAGGCGAAWAWTERTHLDRVAWTAVRAAALLLTEPGRPHVRECAARDCAWLFLDTSRNGTRRWCDMAVCGNREKARRFRAAGAEGAARERVIGRTPAARPRAGPRISRL